MKYFFVLGNAPGLARAEVKAILSCKELLYEPPVLILETEDEIPFDRFGGVVKVGEIIDKNIGDFLKKSGTKSIDFGVSSYDQSDVVNLSKEIKRELVEEGIKTRFILPQKREKTLSSVVVRKQLLTEFLISQNIVAKTIWSQDFEDWGIRDFGRPAVDPHIGMLPPKVARMMINIAVGSKQLADNIIFDPFCGVGTILIEALTIGLKAIGSDFNANQIAKTKKNLEWFGKDCPLQIADARKVIVPLVDAIVTEPFLGPADPKILEQLYLDCFKHWLAILKPEGKVVIATPFPIDKKKLMDYSILAGPFMYFRTQAKVKRYIWHIQKLPA